jgi:hypothetical protein
MKPITEKTYIKSDWNQGDASPATEELIDNHVLRSNPCNKYEHAQELGDCARLASLIDLGVQMLTVAGEPISDETTDEYMEKVSISRNGPSIGSGGFRLAVVMERVHKGGADQGLWPDHGCWFHQILSHETHDPETNTLRRKFKHEVKSPEEVLSIESSLSDNRVRKVSNSITKSSISHNDNHAVLLKGPGFKQLRHGLLLQ